MAASQAESRHHMSDAARQSPHNRRQRSGACQSIAATVFLLHGLRRAWICSDCSQQDRLPTCLSVQAIAEAEAEAARKEVQLAQSRKSVTKLRKDAAKAEEQLAKVQQQLADQEAALKVIYLAASPCTLFGMAKAHTTDRYGGSEFSAVCNWRHWG